MLRLLIRLISLSVLLGACCAAPQATTRLPTAFVATVVAVQADYVLGHVEGQTRPLRLELPHTGLTEGVRLYVQGELDAQGRITVSSFQRLSK